MDELTVDQLIAQIKDEDDAVRAAAWQAAATMGAPAVRPLAKLMTDENIEVARAAKRALWKIVRHAGRPDGERRKKRAVVGRLCSLLSEGQSDVVLSETLWMLSEIGGGKRVVDAIRKIPELTENRKVYEDTRCALQRIPGKAATEALQNALEHAPEEFKYAIAESLRDRGVKVEGYPSQKLVPKKETKVKPVGR